MDNLNLISNFAEFKELKNIDKSTMIGVLEDVFRHALQKQYETDENFDVIINPEKGDLEIWRNRTVVEDDAVEDPNAQISVSEVKAIDPTYEIGDEYADEIKLSSFGRRAVLSLRQNLASRILDLEKASLYEKYSEKVGDIVTGEVYQVWKKEVLILDDEENELILPKAEQIPNDFYRKGDTTIMIDAGYNYDRLEEKMGWLGIAPQSIRHILITHQDTDHVGAVEADSPGLFRNAKLYIGEIENRYLTGEARRKVIYHLYKLPQVTINNEKVLLHDGEVIDIDGIRIECFLIPGHTWGHMVYLVDGKYLFTGDTLWFGADGGYSFISALAEDNKLAVKSLALLEKKLKKRGLHPLFITGHTGWTDNMEFAFAHKNELCSPFKKKVHDPSAPYDAYDESDDTEENAKSGFLKGVGR